MSDVWIDRLSEYLDGDLPETERAALEQHVVGCAECRAALLGLKRVVSRAQGLQDRAPAADLWPGIAERIGARQVVPLRARAARRITFSLSQLAAAGIGLATLSGGSVWLLRPAVTPVAVQPAPPAPAVAANPASTAGTGSGRAGGYDAAIADLESILTEGRGRLDSTTVQVLEQNLAAIDLAIAQARRAVAADSADLYLNSHLAATMRRKLELLRQAATLVSTAS